MECQFPTVNADMSEIADILETNKVIAIIGLSPDESKDSNRVAKYLQNYGYKIIPIYPKEDTILGEKVYRSLNEVKDTIDIVNVFRKGEALFEIVEDVLGRDDVKVIWSQLGVVNNEAMEKAKNAGIKVIQNRCIKIEHQKLKAKN